MPSTRDIIATTGITTPVAVLSFAVKPDETLAPAELVVRLQESVFEAKDTNVVERNGSNVVERNGSAEIVDKLETCVRFVANTSCPPPTQPVKLSREYNRSVALDRKAVGSAVAGLVIVYSGNKLKEEPEVVMQSPFE